MGTEVGAGLVSAQAPKAGPTTTRIAPGWRGRVPGAVLAAGLGIEAIYLVAVLGPFSLLAHGTQLTDLAGLTDHQPIGAAAVTAAVIALFGLYGVAGRALARSTTGELPLVLGGTLAFSLTLIFLYPVTAIDVYNYAVLGHVVAFHHLNPLRVPPSTAQGDAFIAFAGSWADKTTPYGSVWIGLSSLDALVAGSDVVLAIAVFKALGAAAVLATTILIALTYRGTGSRAATIAAALFGWNPLVQIELVGNGHNDGVMVAGLVLALFLLGRRRASAGTVTLAVSAFVKYLTVAAVPFFLLAQLADRSRPWRARLASLARGVGVLLAVSAVAFAPLWFGPTTLSRVREVDNNYLASISALVIMTVAGSIDWILYAQLVLVGAVTLWQATSYWRGRASLERALFEVFFAVILVATHFAGWYLPLLLAVGILARGRLILARAIAFTACTSLTVPLWAYLWPATQDSLGLLGFHWIVVPLTFLPPLALALYGLWQPVSMALAAPRLGGRPEGFGAESWP